MNINKPLPLLYQSAILTCSAALLLAFYLYFTPAIEGLLARWLKFDEAYSHGILIAALVLYLLFLRKTQLLQAINKPNYAALLLLVIVSLIGIISIEVGIDIAQQLLLPPLLWLSFTALFGLRLGYNLLIPLSFFYYAIPFWDYLAIILQIITVEVCEFFLRLLEIPAYITGLEIHLPAGIVEVAHGCSGLRYLLVGLTISSLYSVLYLGTWQRSGLLIVSAILLALLANWLRVFIIIYEGHRTKMASPLMNDHEYFGWFIFAITLIPVFYLGHRLQYQSTNTKNNAADNSVNNDSAATNVSNTRLLSHTAVIILLGFYLPAEFIGRQQTTSFTPISLASQLNNWQQKTSATSLAVEPVLHGYQQALESIYSHENYGSTNLQLYIYPTQKQDHELIQYNNKLIDEKTWVLLEKNTGTAGNTPLAIARLKNRQSQQQHLLVYTYYVSGGFYADNVAAKLAALKGFINGRRDGTVIMLSSACIGDCAKARQAALAFFDTNLNDIKTAIEAGFID